MASHSACIPLQATFVAPPGSSDDEPSWLEEASRKLAATNPPPPAAASRTAAPTSPRHVSLGPFAPAAGEGGPATPAGDTPANPWDSAEWCEKSSPGDVPSDRAIKKACVGGPGTRMEPFNASTPVRRGGSNHVACPTLCYLHVRAAQVAPVPPSLSASPPKARRLPPCPSPALLLRQCHARAHPSLHPSSSHPPHLYTYLDQATATAVGVPVGVPATSSLAPAPVADDAAVPLAVLAAVLAAVLVLLGYCASLLA